MRVLRLLTASALLGGAIVAFTQPVAAQKFPERPVTIVVPFGVGGAFDTLARKLGERWEQELGVPFLVKSLPGAGGRRGSIEIFRSKPDGYTIGFAHFVPFLADEFLMRRKPTIDYRKFEMIYKIAHDSTFVAVRKDLPFESVHDLAKAGRTIKFATTGIGAITWTEANALAGILNFPIDFVTGYDQLADAMLAMARGDADASLGAQPHFRAVEDDVRLLFPDHSHGVQSGARLADHRRECLDHSGSRPLPGVADVGAERGQQRQGRGANPGQRLPGEHRTHRDRNALLHLERRHLRGKWNVEERRHPAPEVGAAHHVHDRAVRRDPPAALLGAAAHDSHDPAARLGGGERLAPFRSVRRREGIATCSQAGPRFGPPAHASDKSSGAIPP